MECVPVFTQRNNKGRFGRMRHITKVSVGKASTEDITAALEACVQDVLDAMGLGSLTALLKKEDEEPV